MAKVVLRDICKSFGAVDVTKGINLTIDHGSFCVFVGPSGCGKSTLLRILSGLEVQSSGGNWIDGRDNSGFGLSLAKLPKAQIAQKVDATAATLQLTPLLDRKPKALSGGQRQPVATGWAIGRDPKVFLFDEPLSNLDASLRVQMRLVLTELHAKLGATMIYVTHDQVEAMTMADTIVVLNGGAVEQVRSPMDLYDHPATPFVAGFIGSPRMNLYQGQTARAMGCQTCGVRPEHLVMGDQGRWHATIRFVERLGADASLHCDVPGLGPLVARVGGDADLATGASVWLSPMQGKARQGKARQGKEHRFP